MTILRIGVMLTVTVVWAVVYLAPYFNSKAPDAPPVVSGIMLVVVSYLATTAGKDVIKKTKERTLRVRDALKDESADESPR